MALQKQPIIFGFGSVDQKRGVKHAQIGRLMLAQDVFQVKTKAFKKRNGHLAYNTNTNTGSITTGKSLAPTANGLALRTSDSAFVWSPSLSKWIKKGATANIAPAVDVVFPINGTRPVHCDAGTTTYYFSGSAPSNGSSSGTSTIYYRVVDAQTGAEIQPATATAITVTSGDIAASIFPVRAFYSGGFVWFFHGASNTTTTWKFDPANPATAPVAVGNSITATSGVALTSILDMMPTSGGNILVIVNATSAYQACLLDGTTGVYKASPGLVSIAAAPASAYASIFKNGTGSDTFHYFVGTVSISSASVFKISASTLALSTTSSLGTLWGAGSTTVTMCGYLSGVNTYVVYSTDGTATTRELYLTQRTSFSGSATTTTFARGRAPLSEPFTIASNWYIALTHDDDNDKQRAYYLYQDSAATTGGTVVGRTLYDYGGGDFGQRGLAPYPMAMALWPTVTTVNGYVVTLLANAFVAPGIFSTYRIQWDLNAALGPVVSTTSGQIAVFPGAWPNQLAGGSTFAEYQPPMFPRAITVAQIAGSAGFTAGNHSSVALYSFRDVNGNEHLSAPSPAVVNNIITTTNLQRHTVPTLRGINSNIGMSIKLYMSKAGTTSPLYLVKSVANDTTVDTVTMDITTEPVAGETVYTDGGVLENAPPPPFRFAFEWKSRIFLGDTETGDEVWPSKEFNPGYGPQFNSILKVRFTGGTGRVRAGGAVDGNDAVFFKQDAAFYISGAGPDDSGRGNYTPVRLTGAPGCVKPASCITTPLGLMYQAIDGGIYLVKPGLDVNYIGQGVDDLAQTSVVAATLHAKKSQVRFWYDTGIVTVYDYGNPLPEEGAVGQWYEWVNLQAVGACISSDVEHYVTSAGVVWQETEGIYNDVSPILMKLKFPINFAGVAGHAVTYSGTLVGEYLAAHNVQVTYATDVENNTARTSQVFGPKAVAGSPEAFRFQPDEMRAATAEVTIEETGAGTTAAFLLQGVAFEVGVVSGARSLNTTQRL